MSLWCGSSASPARRSWRWVRSRAAASVFSTRTWWPRSASTSRRSVATGASMRAAALAARKLGPKQVVVAVPVAADHTCDEFRDDVDEVVCAFTPEPFYAVGLWYENFEQTSDEEVRELLQQPAAA